MYVSNTTMACISLRIIPHDAHKLQIKYFMFYDVDLVRLFHGVYEQV